MAGVSAKHEQERPPLSEQQERVLACIRASIREQGYPPTVREIGDAIGLSSSSTVHGHMGRLEAKGYIRRDPARPRAVEIVGESSDALSSVMHVPVVGRLAAGLPILAQQSIEEYFPLPSGFVRADDADLFFLAVQGDSMIEAGILDGDFVLVRRQEQVEDGEIVVALVDEGEAATVKRLFREANRIRLQPENRFIDPIYSGDVHLVGKVVGLIRRMR